MTTPPSTQGANLKACPAGIPASRDGHTAPVWNAGSGKWHCECACGWRSEESDTVEGSYAAWNRRACNSFDEMKEALAELLESERLVTAYENSDLSDADQEDFDARQIYARIEAARIKARAALSKSGA